ncbi:MAG: heme/hemin ABC transporter substrate-binding protein [Shewanella sp.]
MKTSLIVPRKLLASALFGLAAIYSSSALAADDANPRIISAGSTITEMLMALGAQDKMIAADLTSKSFVTGTDLPIVGYHRQLSAEGLLSLMPTHLLGSDEMGPDTTLNLLKSAGVDVQTLPSGNNLEDFNARIDMLAELTHTQTKAAEVKAKVVAQINRLEQSKPAKPAKVMFMMISKGRPITVAGEGTTTNTVIELAGAVNPVAEHSNSYKQISSEAIVQMQPDVILLAERTYKKLGGIDGLVAEQPLLAQTPAVKNQRVIAIPSEAIQGGFGLASLALAKSLHDQLAAADVQKIATK